TPQGQTEHGTNKPGWTWTPACRRERLHPRRPRRNGVLQSPSPRVLRDALAGRCSVWIKPGDSTPSKQAWMIGDAVAGIEAKAETPYATRVSRLASIANVLDTLEVDVAKFTIVREEKRRPQRDFHSTLGKSSGMPPAIVYNEQLGGPRVVRVLQELL